jgi:hypothetical protein
VISVACDVLAPQVRGGSVLCHFFEHNSSPVN